MSSSASGSSGSGGGGETGSSRAMRITRSDQSPRAAGIEEGASDGLMRIRIPFSAWFESGWSAGARSRQVLQGVVSGVLVELRSGRDVEGRVQEPVDRSLGMHDRLADVHQLGSVLADHMDPEETPVLTSQH